MNLEDMTKEELIAYIRTKEAEKEKNALENRLRDLEDRVRTLEHLGIEKHFPRR